MQSLAWYRRRLQSMGPAEVCWRVRAVTRRWVDRALLNARARALPLDRLTNVRLSETQSAFGWGMPSGPSEAGHPDVPARGVLIERADELLANRLEFFDVTIRGEEAGIDWNREYAIGKSAPMSFAPTVDYRDFSVTGDAKVVWEPNRHQHLVVLGRAYRATGDERYAAKVVEQIESWIEQCPYGRGMNWRSPLELAIRLINWVFALDYVADSGAVGDGFRARLMSVVHRHLWEIDRNYSRYSSANNHLIGEACGVFVGAAYFRGLRRAERWRDRAAEILQREIQRQTLADGGNCELSPGYHLFVLEFFLLAGLAGRKTGRDFEPAYWDRLASMFEYTAALLEGGDNCPAFGDADDGFVLDLEDEGDRPRSLMGVGAALFDRERLRAVAGACGERVYWLLGPSAHGEFVRFANRRVDGPIESRAFEASGYYLLQTGHCGAPDRISVTFDCGPLGFGSIAAHGHADALSFTLRVGGTDVLVDTGTYDYFTYADWRAYFRSTRAHNTIVVDRIDQSEMTGPFMWGRRANARCLGWEPSDRGGRVRGSHDGYSRLSDPVTHTRGLELDGPTGRVTVRDVLEGKSEHTAEFCLHFAEQCVVEDLGANRFGVAYGTGRLEIRLDSRLETQLLSGRLDPIAGWVSRGYHRKSPATTLIGSWRWRGRTEIVSEILVAVAEEGGDSANARGERERCTGGGDIVADRPGRGEERSSDSRHDSWNR